MPRGGGTGLSAISSSGDAEGRVGEAAAAYRAPLPDLAEPEEEGLPEVCVWTAACAIGATNWRQPKPLFPAVVFPLLHLCLTPQPPPCAQLELAMRHARACQNGAQRLYHIRSLGRVALDAGAPLLRLICRTPLADAVRPRSCERAVRSA